MEDILFMSLWFMLISHMNFKYARGSLTGVN
jgi:hypothetical protein